MGRRGESPGRGLSGASFSGANAPRAGDGLGEGFRVEFLGLDGEGKPVYRVCVEQSCVAAAVRWLFERAGESIEEALEILGYSPEEVDRRPRERITPEKREKRRKLLRLASKLFGKYIMVVHCEGKDIWYKLGLALTDGTIQIIEGYVRASIEFGTTRAELARCVLLAWSRATVCLHDGFYFRGKEPVPSLRFMVKASKSLRRLLLMARRAPRQLAELIANDSERLYSFLAGVVDGDGSVSTSIKVTASQHKTIKVCP